MKALRLPAPLRSRLCLLGLVFALSAHATTYYVTISGLGGEPDYDQRFKMWAQDIDSSLKKAGGDSNVATLDAPTRDQIRARLNAIAKEAKPNDAFVLMLIGHGSYDGVEYKFNLPGPDLGGAELAALLDRIPATRQLVVNMTSASGGSIDFLRKPGRVRDHRHQERHRKRTPRYSPATGPRPCAIPPPMPTRTRPSPRWKLFISPQRKTTEFFDTQKRLATEHCVLEDTGKGEGERNPGTENGEGKLAAAFPLVRLGANAAAARDPAKRPLLEQKEQLEEAIDKLKYDKAAMPADEYKKQLTQLLLQLAKVQEEIDK